MAKRAILATMRDRHRSSPKKDNSRVLEKFIAVTGHHRKHGIRLLGQSGDTDDSNCSRLRGRKRFAVEIPYLVAPPQEAE